MVTRYRGFSSDDGPTLSAEGIGRLSRPDVKDGETDRRDLGHEEDLAVRELGRSFPAVGAEDADRFGGPAGEFDGRLDDVLARDGQAVGDDDGRALNAGVEGLGDRSDGAREHAAELVQGQDLVVPRVFVSLGQACPGDDVVELAAHDQGPGVVEPTHGIGSAAQPVSRDRGPLGVVRQDLVAAVPALHVRLADVIEPAEWFVSSRSPL